MRLPDSFLSLVSSMFVHLYLGYSTGVVAQVRRSYSTSPSYTLPSSDDYATTLLMAGHTRRTEGKTYYVNAPSTNGKYEAGVSNNSTRRSYQPCTWL